MVLIIKKKTNIWQLLFQETFVAQSQDILSSTIVPSSSPLLARKPKEQPPIPPARDKYILVKD